jgi:hypothetical protein
LGEVLAGDLKSGRIGVLAGAPTDFSHALYLDGQENPFSGGREHTHLGGYALD